MVMKKQKIFKKPVFFRRFLKKKYSKIQNFWKKFIGDIAIGLKNMWFKFHKDRSSSFENLINKASKNVVSRKTRLKFFLHEILKKKLLTPSQRCLDRTKFLQIVRRVDFLPIFSVSALFCPLWKLPMNGGCLLGYAGGRALEVPTFEAFKNNVRVLGSF